MSLDLFICQPDIDVEDRIATLYRMLELAKKKDSDLVVFPEGYLNLQKDQSALEESIRAVREKNVSSLLGVITNSENMAVFIDREGEIGGEYRKRCLFADEKSKFKKGKSPLIFSLKDYKISPTICYDLFFPEIGRELCEKGVDLIPVLATIKENQENFWYSLLRVRAAENAVPIVASCNISEGRRIMGGSCIAEPGRKLEMMGGEGYMAARINPEDYEELKGLSPEVDADFLFQEGFFGPYLGDRGNEDERL